MKSKTNSDPSGFIKLDRKILDWEWWDDITTFRLFMTILLMANWEDKKWKGKTIKRGQLWTSLPSLSEKAHLSIQQTRSSLDKLKATGEITDRAYSKFRVITVVKYDEYQKDNRQDNSQSTGNQQASNRQSTGNQQQYNNNNNGTMEKGRGNRN